MAKKVDYTQLAKEVIRAVGGKENINGVTNCMTRLRFVLKDDSIPNSEEVKLIKDVKGVMNKGGQYQVIIGTHVNEVIKFVNQELGFKGDEKATEDKVEEKGNLFNRFFNYANDRANGCRGDYQRNIDDLCNPWLDDKN